MIDPNDTVDESNYNNNASTTTVSTVLTPALTTSTIDVAPIVNTSFTGAVASFTDALAFNLNTYSATINWGDGGSSAGTVTLSTSGSGLYVVTGTHTYTSTGTEPVSVSLNDGIGDTATITSSTALVGQAPLQITAVPVNVDAINGIQQPDRGHVHRPGHRQRRSAGSDQPIHQPVCASIDWGDGSGATERHRSTFDPTTGQSSAFAARIVCRNWQLLGERDRHAANAFRSRASIPAAPTGLTKSPSADFIDQFYTDETNQTAPINTIALPTVSTNSGNRALTTSSLSPSEARIYLSANGQYLVMMGNNDTTADTSPQSYLETPSQVNRVIGTIDAEGDVNTTTALADAYNGDNTRGATSVDGQEFWTDGSAISGRYQRRPRLCPLCHARLDHLDRPHHGDGRIQCQRGRDLQRPVV